MAEASDVGVISSLSCWSTYSVSDEQVQRQSRDVEAMLLICAGGAQTLIVILTKCNAVKIIATETIGRR